MGQHAGGPVSLEMSHRLPLLCALNGACTMWLEPWSGAQGLSLLCELLYFAVQKAHFCAQMFEGKITVHIIHGYNDWLPWV